MNGLLKYSFPICFSLLALFACEDDGIDVDNIEVPAGFALSAGTATNFLTSSYAYDRSADWITGAYDKRFTRGDKLYDDIRTSSNGIGGGLGPVYAGYSCGSCHRNAGRTQPTLWSEGGSGSSGFSSMLVYISRATGMQGALNPLYGQRADRAAMVSPPCWFTYPVRTELSFRIMDVCFMIRLFMV